MTDNESMHDFASQVLKVSLNGLSLTVISFTIVFLFHGVGGGLFCGTVLFRLVFYIFLINLYRLCSCFKAKLIQVAKI